MKNGYRDRTANNYYVNANTNMPSILLEVGFISSDEDNRAFDENIDKMAVEIAKVIYRNKDTTSFDTRHGCDLVCSKRGLYEPIGK